VRKYRLKELPDDRWIIEKSIFGILWNSSHLTNSLGVPYPHAKGTLDRLIEKEDKLRKFKPRILYPPLPRTAP
jgi:hypothetical protein